MIEPACNAECKRIESLVENFPGPLEVWENHVSHHPSDTVLSDTLGSRLTRSEVEQQANCVNAFLRDKGIGKEDVVMVRLNRGVNPIVACLGVWKAGAAFCLVESDYAPERIAYIRENCGVKIDINEDNWEEVLATPPSSELAQVEDHDAAMFVYTSGTTGTPKGVLHEFGQAKMEILSETQADGKTRQNRKTRWALGAPLNFVASLKIFVHFLYSGGHLYVLDYETAKNPTKLSMFFLTNRINETFLAPMHLRAKDGDLGPFMKVVYCGASPVNNVYLKHGTLVNNYSMSESFFTVCDFIVDKAYANCPIGNPSFDLGIKLYGEGDAEVAPGEVGEICFPNPFFRGYVGLDEENEKRFVNGLFRSRDMARKEGDLYFMAGRGDDMIKINGNRVEPQEIEATFHRITGLHCAAKGFAEDGEGYVALYYVKEDGEKLDVADVRRKMEESLPYYMVPSYFVKIDRIPLTNLGKLDRKSLKKPRIKRKKYIAPVGDLETKLAAAAAKALELEKVGRDEDLFSLGGSSMTIIEVLSDMDLPGLSAETFYRGKTIEGVARLYEEEMGAGSSLNMTEEEMELEGRKHDYPLRNGSLNLYKAQKAVPEQTDSLNLGQAFKLSRLVSLEKMRDAINEYISHSSTFQTSIFEGSDGVPYFHYAPERFKPIEIEKMGGKEAKELAQNFKQPFKLTEELPWRIRIIKTLKGGYLLFDIHHVLTDGEGVNLIGEDIVNSYLGKEVRPNNFYSFLYRQEALINSPFFEDCKKNLHARFDNVDWPQLPKNQKEEFGVHVKSFDTGISIDELNSYLAGANRSRSDLFMGAYVLAMHEMTGSDNIIVSSCYANRTGVDNVAGLRVLSPTHAFDLSDMPTDIDIYLDMISAEVRDGISTACYDYRSAKEGFDTKCPIIDDLGDIETLPEELQRFVEPVVIETAAEEESEPDGPSSQPHIIFYLNDENKLIIRSHRDVYWLADDVRDEFINRNIEALHQLMAGGKF